MTYPGNPELSPQAQERVMAAFRQVIAKIQDGQRDEAVIGLEFVLRLDPTFAPGVALQQQFSSGAAEIDLSAVIAQLEAPNTDAINLMLIEAVEEFNQRNYLEAKERVEKVLIELPGHAEARALAGQIDEALKIETQVGKFLTQAKEALASGKPEDAANFVMMAQALDPHHAGIESALAEIRKVAPSGPPPTAEVPGEAFSPAATLQVEPDFTDVPQPPAFEPPPETDAPPESSPPPESAPAEESGSGIGAFFLGPDSESAPTTPDVQAPEPVAQPEAANDQASFEAPGTAEFWSEPEAAQPAPEPPAVVPAVDDAPPQGTAEQAEFELGGDVTDLFEASADANATTLWDEPAVEPVAPPEEDDGEVAELLEKGRAALDAGDPQEALHHLSRILLIDPENSAAGQLIDRARAAVDEIQNEIQSKLSEAELVWQEGKADEARTLIEEVLKLSPEHPEALDLQQTFSGAPAAETPPGASDEPVLPPIPEPEAGPTGPSDGLAFDDLIPSDLDEEFEDEPLPPVPDEVAPPGRTIPWRWIGLGGGAIAVILLGMWLGSILLPGNGDGADMTRQVTERLEQAQKLFDNGQTDEALELLRTSTVDGLDKQRIDNKIAQFEAALVPPTPTPIPKTFLEARALLDNGQWLAAYEQVNTGLQEHPQDAGLLSLKEEISTIEPRVVALFGTLAKNDFQVAVGLATELGNDHPDQAGFSAILNRCLFNAALVQLRNYNLTAARNYLLKLRQRTPDDEDVDRILEFISKYMNRPADMQLQIFVGSLQFR